MRQRQSKREKSATKTKEETKRVRQRQSKREKSATKTEEEEEKSETDVKNCAFKTFP